MKCRVFAVCWSFRSGCSLHIFHMWHNFKETLRELKMKVCVLNVYPMLAIHWNKRYKEMNIRGKKPFWFDSLYWIYIAVLEGQFCAFRSHHSKMVHLYLYTYGHRRNVYKLRIRYNQVKIASLILSGIKNLPIAFNLKLNMRGRCKFYLLWARCSNLSKIMQFFPFLLQSFSNLENIHEVLQFIIN